MPPAPSQSLATHARMCHAVAKWSLAPDLQPRSVMEASSCTMLQVNNEGATGVAHDCSPIEEFLRLPMPLGSTPGSLKVLFGDGPGKGKEL